MKKYKKINKNNGFSLIEISIVMIILFTIFGIVYTSITLVNLTKLSNSINITTKARFINDEDLVLWIETSVLSKLEKSGNKINTWKDLSRFRNNLVATSGDLTLMDSKIFPWMKSIYLDGQTVLSSSKFINLPNKYTMFIVLYPDADNLANLYNSGTISLLKTEFEKASIIEITDDGIQKCLKTAKNTNFLCSSSEFNESTKSQNIKLTIGEAGFKGEFFGCMLFKRVLSSKDIENVEKYLYDKYLIK